jgi:hypothetical protein
MIKNNRLLIDESLLTFQPTLAAVIGLNGAIFLQQLQYWIKNAEKRGEQKYYFEGRWWIYNSYPEWVRNNFPFWSVRTIERIVEFLEHDLHVVLSREDPELGGRKWYTIDYDQLERLDVLPLVMEREPAEIEPEPVQLRDPAKGTSSIPKACSPRFHGHERGKGYRIPRQVGRGTPRQVDETPLVKLTRPPSSSCQGAPRQVDEGSTRRLKGTLTETTTETSTETGGRAPEGAPAISPLKILTPPVRRTGLTALTLPAQENPMTNFFAADQELWDQRIQAWRSGRKQEAT